MKAALISDTHGLLRSPILAILKEADVILHAGDINSQAVVEQLQQCGPLYVVRGNNDKEWAEKIPKCLKFSLEGVNFFMVHNKKDVPEQLADTDVVIYGHSHKYAEEKRDNMLWLNPGSCGPRRFHQEITMAMMTIADKMYTVEKILIPHEVN